MPIACPFRQKAKRLWMERKVIRKPDPGKCKAVWDALLQNSHTCFRTLRQGDGLIRYTKRINIATLVLRPSCLAKPASGICSRCGRRFPRFACGCECYLPALFPCCLLPGERTFPQTCRYPPTQPLFRGRRSDRSVNSECLRSFSVRNDAKVWGCGWQRDVRNGAMKADSFCFPECRKGHRGVPRPPEVP